MANAVDEGRRYREMAIPARLSLRSLFAIVASAAVATAVLLRPSFFIASAVWSVTVLVLGAAIIGAVASSGASRAFWTGFALFGSVHLILATAPWFDDVTGEFIVTRQILDKLGAILQYDVAELPSMPGIWHNLPWSVGDKPTEGYGYLPYLMAGQSIFSLVIGYMGGAIGRYFYSRRPDK
jgi:hypothetical protein